MLSPATPACWKCSICPIKPMPTLDVTLEAVAVSASMALPGLLTPHSRQILSGPVYTGLSCALEYVQGILPLGPLISCITALLRGLTSPDALTASAYTNPLAVLAGVVYIVSVASTAPPVAVLYQR